MKRRLCPKCLKEFKKNSGKSARRANGGTWKGIKWPLHLYHESESSRLCSRHFASDVKRLGSIYSARRTLLLSIGFSSYREYLSSCLWRTLRETVLSESGGLCEFCRCPATQVHHSRYDIATLTGDSLDGLHPVCGACHRNGEFFPSGDKCTPFIATQRMSIGRQFK
jgi:hypothetical protein